MLMDVYTQLYTEGRSRMLEGPVCYYHMTQCMYNICDYIGVG